MLSCYMFPHGFGSMSSNRDSRMRLWAWSSSGHQESSVPHHEVSTSFWSLFACLDTASPEGHRGTSCCLTQVPWRQESQVWLSHVSCLRLGWMHWASSPGGCSQVLLLPWLFPLAGWEFGAGRWPVPGWCSVSSWEGGESWRARVAECRRDHVLSTAFLLWGDEHISSRRSSAVLTRTVCICGEDGNQNLQNPPRPNQFHNQNHTGNL